MSSEVPAVTAPRNSDAIQIPPPEAGIDVRSMGRKRALKGSEASSENKSQLSRSSDPEGLAKLFGVQPLNLESKKRTASECQTGSVIETVNWTAVLASLQVSIAEIFRRSAERYSLMWCVPVNTSEMLIWQREKRLAIARKEEHYVNRSLFYFTSSSKLRCICKPLSSVHPVRILTKKPSPQLFLSNPTEKRSSNWWSGPCSTRSFSS
jgi:hypothetical protein